MPPVTSTLGAPQLLFQRKTEQTTDPSLMRKMPSLSTCQAVRSSLYKMKEKASEKVKMECEQVARWQNFGTFSRDDITYFVCQHEMKTTKREVEEEERWLNQLLSICCCAAIASDARTFMETIWASPPKSTVLSSGIAAEQLSKLCCGRWLSCEIIESVFELMNQMGPAHYLAVCSEAVIHSVRAKQRLISLIINKLPQALNVKRLNDGKVLLGNGNHWTYFVFSATLDELYYGDSLGWNLPANLLLVMKPIFEALYSASGKAYVRPTFPVLMHPLLPSNSRHMCSSRCFQAFPQQNCANACGLSPLFMAAVAATKEYMWSSIVKERTPRKEL